MSSYLENHIIHIIGSWTAGKKILKEKTFANPFINDDLSNISTFELIFIWWS